MASRPAHLPMIEAAEDALHSFTASGRVLFYIFAGLLVVSSLSLLYLLNQSLLIAVPAHGGTFKEGIIGVPRFINPVLATTDADRDLTALVYSGLLRMTPSGSYVPDLAESYAISDDGRTYSFTLREGMTFHDGEPIRADDVVFTITKIQDPAVRSSLRASWDGIVAETVDKRTVRFTLKEPYAPFIKNVTVGILPQHLWQDTVGDDFSWSEHNIMPIGSGPFKVHTITRSTSGIPSSYELRPFKNYALGRPYLDRIVLRFYQSEQALIEGLRRGEVEAGGGLSPELVVNFAGETVRHAPQNRVFSVFFNQNQSEVLRDKTAREALSLATNRLALVERVLHGYGTALTEPVPPVFLPWPVANVTSASDEEADRPALARERLLANGWVESDSGVLKKRTGNGSDRKTLEFSLSLSTSNTPELRAAAEELRAAWERMGARVDVHIFESGDLSQNVIRPRRYDALLFGQVIGRELDLYAFWHSSQRNDPGLNVALYANSAADRALESLRSTTDPAERRRRYEQFISELADDTPALFLYAPDFVYIFPERVKGLQLGFVETPSDRFLSVAQWHIYEESVWPFFAYRNH